MRLFIFAVKDSATDSFGSPMFLISSGQATRSFTDEVNRRADDNQLYKHPDDFSLFSLGEFDTTSGVFTSTMPNLVVRGKDVRSSE